MTNSEFIKKYGFKELLDLLSSTDIRLGILKSYGKISGFKVSRRKKIVHLYKNGKKGVFDVAYIYSLKDEEITTLVG